MDQRMACTPGTCRCTSWVCYLWELYDTTEAWWCDYCLYLHVTSKCWGSMLSSCGELNHILILFSFTAVCDGVACLYSVAWAFVCNCVVVKRWIISNCMYCIPHCICGWVGIQFCNFLSTVPSFLWCFGDALSWQMACRAMDHICFLWNTSITCLYFCFLCSYRAKPAGNSNDAGGMDDTDLEKMKQVNVFSAQEHKFLTKSAEPKLW